MSRQESRSCIGIAEGVWGSRGFLYRRGSAGSSRHRWTGGWSGCRSKSRGSCRSSSSPDCSARHSAPVSRPQAGNARAQHTHTHTHNMTQHNAHHRAKRRPRRKQHTRIARKLPALAAPHLALGIGLDLADAVDGGRLHALAVRRREVRTTALEEPRGSGHRHWAPPRTHQLSPAKLGSHLHIIETEIEPKIEVSYSRHSPPLRQWEWSVHGSPPAPPLVPPSKS